MHWHYGAILWRSNEWCNLTVEPLVIFMHLADAIIQSHLHCIQSTHFYQFFLSLAIKPKNIVLLALCSTVWATGTQKETLSKRIFNGTHICIQLICAVCGIHKLTTIHCDYYHANKNKCFLKQIYVVHCISL